MKTPIQVECTCIVLFHLILAQFFCKFELWCLFVSYLYNAKINSIVNQLLKYSQKFKKTWLANGYGENAMMLMLWFFSIFSLWFTRFQRIKSTSQEEAKYKAIEGHCSKERLVIFSMLKIVYMMHHNQLDDLMIS